MTELRETVALEPCPFCGDEMVNWRGLVRHPRNDDCVLGQIAFYTSHADLWNTRHSQGDGLREACGCPVHHRPDCEHRPRIPTHAYKPHPKWPWFCEDCGYPEHERLKHHLSALAAQEDRWQKGAKVKWARSLDQRPLAIVGLETVTIASRFAPLSITLEECPGVFPIGWFDALAAQEGNSR